MNKALLCLVLVAPVLVPGGRALAEGKWEVTPASEAAAELGLEWLARNQGDEGNWGCKDLGLVSVGALAFLSAGHTAETGKYSENVRKALDYVLANAKPSGLFNIAGHNRDTYNHGLTTFVLTQAYGITNDKRVGKALTKAIKVIVDTQCLDGGWDYQAQRQERGHDLSLAVMQAKALRGAMDIGIHIPRATIGMAIKSVQDYYRSSGGQPLAKDKWAGQSHPLAKYPGRFTYNGGSGTTAMAAAGSVCLQEFERYDDFRIYRSMDGVLDDIRHRMRAHQGSVPFDAYTLYYVAQALYQVGGHRWKEGYPPLRDALVKCQVRDKDPRRGAQGWETYGSWDAGSRVGGKDGRLYGTATAVFVLCIPNRYLPILQQGKLEGGESASTHDTRPRPRRESATGAGLADSRGRRAAGKALTEE